MELSIKGTPEEIKNVLQAIGGSEEHKEVFDCFGNLVNRA